jgi:hypothetical protein
VSLFTSTFVKILKLTFNKNIEGPREATGEGEPNQILLQESTYVPSLNSKAKTLQEGHENTNQQRRNDPLKVTNAAEKE